eukprot:COSAG02_NODE_23094_length_730_cov_1.172742_1_plen_158_part_00
MVAAAHRGGVRSTRSDSASPVSAEEDARAQRVAEAAASLVSSSDPRPTRVEFEGIKPNGADMDLLDEMDESAVGSKLSAVQKAMDTYYNGEWLSNILAGALPSMTSGSCFLIHSDTSPRAGEEGESPTSASAHQVPAAVVRRLSQWTDTHSLVIVPS